ncbi:hypothetical protein KO361_04640 [Candidatus Woesearchaeota archaeon]|nr:hypothetical protein [Candidatus Woesearchaeota archaeon]
MSANKKYELTTNSGDETAKMWHSENGKKRFVGTCFIDPGNTNQDVTRANKYLQNSLGITNLYHSKQ